MKLREVKHTSQRPGEPGRRWFSSEQMDLFVWFDDDGEIIGFQLTYDKPHSEKALVWKAGEGLGHSSVDDGHKSGKYPGSPLFVPDGEPNPSRIIELLEQHGDEVDARIRQFIVARIESR